MGCSSGHKKKRRASDQKSMKREEKRNRMQIIKWHKGWGCLFTVGCVFSNVLSFSTAINLT
jgi:hypothetical protein